MNIPKLTLEQFAAWLATKADEEVVGRHSGLDWCSQCPVANYLKEQGYADVVTGTTYVWMGKDESIGMAMPADLANFVGRVDRSMRWMDTITAGIARSLLEEVHAS